MEELLKLISNLGFPIVVAAYLLIRIEEKLDELSTAIISLREAIITLPAEAYWLPNRSNLLLNKEESAPITDH